MQRIGQFIWRTLSCRNDEGTVDEDKTASNNTHFCLTTSSSDEGEHQVQGAGGHVTQRVKGNSETRSGEDEAETTSARNQTAFSYEEEDIRKVVTAQQLVQGAGGHVTQGVKGYSGTRSGEDEGNQTEEEIRRLPMLEHRAYFSRPRNTKPGRGWWTKQQSRSFERRRHVQLRQEMTLRQQQIAQDAESRNANIEGPWTLGLTGPLCTAFSILHTFEQSQTAVNEITEECR